MGPGVEAFLVYAVAALCSCAVSFALGRHWPSPRQLDDAYDEGRGDGIAEMRDLLAADLDRSAVDAGDRRALPSAVPAGASGSLPVAELDVPRPGPDLQVQGEVAPRPSGPGYPPWSRAQAAEESGSDNRIAHGPGRLPSQDTYRAELARIGRPDPAPWYAALIAEPAPPSPGPAPEPAWYERVTYREAIEWGAIKMWHHEDQEIYHAHVDEWDRFIAAWGVEARWVTVGCRAWPPPGLVPA